MIDYREYRYVGSRQILENLPDTSDRVLVQTSEDVLQWIIKTNQPREYNDLVIATFIIDLQGQLWINERRSEHVLCANGAKVLSAGEMSFQQNGKIIEVVEVTNQSTGYCPEPESWWAVNRALENANITHPTDFTMKYIFRRCEQCGSINLVKEEWYECGVCGSSLNSEWNFETI